MNFNCCIASKRKRRILCIALALLVILLALILDLVITPFKEFSVQSITIDSTRTLPLVTLIFDLQDHVHFSKITPKGLSCELFPSSSSPDGTAAVTVVGELTLLDQDDDEYDDISNADSSYELTMTSTEESIPALTDLIWELMIDEEQEQSSLEDITCDFQVEVLLAHIIPFTVTKTLTREQMGNMQGKGNQKSSKDEPSACSSK